MATIPSGRPPLKFSKAPGFNPYYTPREILELGVFNGTYFFKYALRSGLPDELFDKLPESRYNLSQPDANVNYFKALTVQRRRDDFIPNALRLLATAGWLMWYCRFYYGKTTNTEDAYRIKQWKDEIETFYFYVKEACDAANRPYDDLNVAAARPWRQQLLQYGMDPAVIPGGPNPIDSDALTDRAEVLTFNGETLIDTRTPSN